MEIFFGLRSHGLVESRWIPTKGRFVSLEEKDESWAKFFGLGQTVTLPMELYDVRDFSGKLIGYSNQDPAKAMRPVVELSVLEGRNDRQCWIDRSEQIKRGSIKTIQLRVREIAVECDRFVCWYVCVDDAEALAWSGWLKCIGEDRLSEFIWDLRKKRCEHGYWNAKR